MSIGGGCGENEGSAPLGIYTKVYTKELGADEEREKKEVKKGKNENGIYNSADSDIGDVSISSVQHTCDGCGMAGALNNS